jgi:hypothetical protein
MMTLAAGIGRLMSGGHEAHARAQLRDACANGCTLLELDPAILAGANQAESGARSVGASILWELAPVHQYGHENRISEVGLHDLAINAKFDRHPAARARGSLKSSLARPCLRHRASPTNSGLEGNAFVT